MVGGAGGRASMAEGVCVCVRVLWEAATAHVVWCCCHGQATAQQYQPQGGSQGPAWAWPGLAMRGGGGGVMCCW